MLWVVLGVVAGGLAALIIRSRIVFGRTARGMAAFGKVDALRALLEKEPERASELDDNGETPVFAAAARGHVEIVELLLRHGASPNARCEGGGTPLLMAAAFGNAAVVQRLVAGGADVDDCDDQGVTAMHFAINREHADVVRLLLDLGAQPDLKDAAGRTALDVAHEFERRELVTLLEARGARRGAQVKMRDLKPPKAAGGVHRVPMALGVPVDHPAMNEAKAKARAAIPELRRLFAENVKVAVKGPLDASNPEEKLWLGVNALDERKALGVMISSPIQSLRQEGAPAELPLEQLEDWLAELPDGSYRGGFGLKVLFAHAQDEYGALPAAYTDVAAKLPA